MSTTENAIDHDVPATPTAVLRGSSRPLRAEHDVLLLDLDGVVYVGPHAVPHAAEALTRAEDAGARLAYITNNASRPPSTVSEHLRALGAPARDEDVVTSAQAAARHLAERLPSGSRVLLVGGEGLREALEASGLEPVESLADDPAAVVQGFSPDTSWARLAEATHAVRAGLWWVATNLDATVPTPGGPAPGNGLLVQLVARAAGREPDVVCGKPERALFDEAVARSGARNALVVGDRLDTDLQGARAAGLPGLLVLTGVTGARELLAAAPHERPHLIGRDLRSLDDEHPVPVLEHGGDAIVARCRGAEVGVGSEGAFVRSAAAGPDGLDVLRAAAEAAWAVRDAQTYESWDVDLGELAELVAHSLTTDIDVPGDDVPGAVGSGL
ncbi:HAD-IIA family hydrolase [Paenibacillus sp. TRM 82003]|uniref:HAD-IIA family hydrolase n=1 Tax=Kineococcus sp. TRM81007 TaxID=2925831 RepID=UPI001F58299B|nr:HAD-IIA family hydrolase [Kineococcus sp. TRM81007]MCI2240740.1 HAD-IIA family hydrolase [Kineococcus sp. TRM81007]MCI3925336.1 HAD-IIA family hydrolase [Paenibacillus sp. TRM 82003]